MELKVALCQTAMEWENPQVNLRRIERMLVGVDADLVVLPLSLKLISEPTTLRRK